MVTFRLMGLFALIPAAVLLTISFFVLVVLRKAESEGLKAFGYVVATLLWIAAVLVISTGIYTVYTGRYPMKCMIQEMMQGKMHGMMGTYTPKMMPGQK